MHTRITRPTLANLWRHIRTRLECRGAVDAPALARSLAVAAMTGRPAESPGLIRVERRGEDFVVTLADPLESPGACDCPRGWMPMRRRARHLATR